MKLFQESCILLFMGIRRTVFPHLHSPGDCMYIAALSQIWSSLSKTLVSITVSQMTATKLAAYNYIPTT